jgi:hypothetical protein
MEMRARVLTGLLSHPRSALVRYTCEKASRAAGAEWTIPRRLRWYARDADEATSRRRIAKKKGGFVMKGVVVFRSITDALRAGYQVCGRTEDGYLVRVRTTAGWAMALVVCD